MIALVLALALAGQSAGLIWLFNRTDKRAAEERRVLVTHALADSASQFVAMASASRPDDTMEALAEARATTPRAPSPLGL